MSLTRQEEPITAQRPEPPPPPDDDALDYAAVLMRYEAPLLRYAARMLGGSTFAEDAQDIVQETFIRLHKQVNGPGRGLSGIQNMTTWLYRVAHNLAIDAIRRKVTRRESIAKERVEMELERRSSDDGDTLDALSALGQKEAQEQAMLELDRLPETQRCAITLKVIEGMTMKQIGEVLGMAPSNVCYHMTQGLGELSRRLRTRGVV